MADTTALLAAAQGSQAIASVGSTVTSVQAEKAKADYQRRISELNARAGEEKARQTEKAGEQAAARKRQEVRQVQGAQRAALAAGGADLGFGSAADIQAETAQIGEADVLAIRTNALREAFGYRSGAEAVRGESEFRDIASRQKRRATLISGGIESLGYGLKAAHTLKDK